ncbi:MAG TPA: NrfD/PsrC family molybdoenzyme membrane anchor subunit [Streptosporangiaceae bacterium]|nr:NrfD/PsrC family molybdoenzyme membrane anchor subunit [Streptosporangiaceae bacterium]
MAASTASVPVPAARPGGGLRGVRLWYVLLALAGLLGVVAWIYELQHGLAATGMRDVVSWGMYIFTFAFFIGLSAGGLIMASSAEVFGIADLKPLARLGVLSAAACVTVAAIMILPDLGRPDRILNIFIHPNWTSPLIWDILIISVYFTFSVVDLVVLQRHESEPSRLRKAIRVLAYVGLPTAVLLHSVTAWIFGLQIARTWWNTALMAPLFVVSAILSGTGLVTLLALAAQRWGGFALSAPTRRWLRGFIAIALIVDLFFVGCEYVTVLWGNVPADRSALDLVLPGGAYAWTFWAEWMLGGVVPLAFLLAPRLRRVPGSLGLAAFLAIAGVYAFRIELVVIGFINPLTQFPPGNAIGTYNPATSSFELVGRYSPTWVEYSIILGLFALFGAIMTVGYRRLFTPSAAGHPDLGRAVPGAAPSVSREPGGGATSPSPASDEQ